MKSTILKPILFSLMLASPIFSAGRSISMAAESVGEYVDDAKITASVKAKLTAEKAANFTKIGVETSNKRSFTHRRSRFERSKRESREDREAS